MFSFVRQASEPEAFGEFSKDDVFAPSHFFEKKLMMFPCPVFAPAPFFAGPLVPIGFAEDAIFGFLGAGSSSEKDSQPGSSRVTACNRQFMSHHISACI